MNILYVYTASLTKPDNFMSTPLLVHTGPSIDEGTLVTDSLLVPEGRSILIVYWSDTRRDTLFFNFTVRDGGKDAIGLIKEIVYSRLKPFLCVCLAIFSHVKYPDL